MSFLNLNLKKSKSLSQIGIFYKQLLAESSAEHLMTLHRLFCAGECALVYQAIWQTEVLATVVLALGVVTHNVLTSSGKSATSPRIDAPMFGTRFLMFLDFIGIGGFDRTSGGSAGVGSAGIGHVHAHAGSHLTDFVDIAQTGQLGWSDDRTNGLINMYDFSIFRVKNDKKLKNQLVCYFH